MHPLFAMHAIFALLCYYFYAAPCSTVLSVRDVQAFNVLHYQQEQEKESHMDTYDPKDFGPQSTQRMTTMILVLSNVEEGGETVFKREGKDGELTYYSEFDGSLWLPCWLTGSQDAAAVSCSTKDPG